MARCRACGGQRPAPDASVSPRARLKPEKVASLSGSARFQAYFATPVMNGKPFGSP